MKVNDIKRNLLNNISVLTAGYLCQPAVVHSPCFPKLCKSLPEVQHTHLLESKCTHSIQQRERKWIFPCAPSHTKSCTCCLEFSCVPDIPHKSRYNQLYKCCRGIKQHYWGIPSVLIITAYVLTIIWSQENKGTPTFNINYSIMVCCDMWEQVKSSKNARIQTTTQ